MDSTLERDRAVSAEPDPNSGKGIRVPEQTGPTRIGFCITDLDVGGAERALVQLATRLDRRDWEPAVFCLSPPGALVAELEAASITVVCLGARRLRDIGIVSRLRRELQKFRPEILQTYLFHANLAGRWAAWRAGVPHVVCGIRVAERRTKLHLWLDRCTHRLVDKYVCVSRDVAEFSMHTGRLPAHKIEVIGNGVDAAVFENAVPASLTQFGISPGSRVVVTVARLDPQKGLRDLVAAAERVTHQHPDLHFLIVGDGPERAGIELAIHECGLSARVHLAGRRSDIPQILRAGFCFVLSSHWEGMPNAVLEAMAAGLPVIATRVEGIDELVREGETGFTVPPRAPAELASAIEKLVRSPELAAKLGAGGLSRARERFGWDQTVAHYLRLYRALLNGRSRPE